MKAKSKHVVQIFKLPGEEKNNRPYASAFCAEPGELAPLRLRPRDGERGNRHAQFVVEPRGTPHSPRSLPPRPGREALMRKGCAPLWAEKRHFLPNAT